MVESIAGREPNVGWVRRWQLLALALICVITAVLVIVAFSVARPPQDGNAIAQPSSQPGGAPPTPVATPPATPITAPARTIVALNESSAWRSTTGACPGAAIAMEYTRDGGVTWTPSTSIAELGLSATLSLIRGPGGLVSAVGQSETLGACSPQLFTTVARADGWELTDGVEQHWFAAVVGTQNINSPSGPATAPCAVIVLRAADPEHAALLCDDERVFRSSDGGASWDDGIVVPGARSLGESIDGYIVPAVGQPGCAGVQLKIVYLQTAPRDGAPAGCRETAAAGDISISITGETVWLWTGDEIAITVDRGITWT